MSRLYAWLESDTNNSNRTITGNEYIECIINWGSAGNSKRACRMFISWEKNENFPTVYFNKGDNIK